MKIKFTKLLLILTLLTLCFTFFSSVHALEENPVEMYLFYGQGCPHCAKAELFLNDLEAHHPNLNVIRKEVYFNQENRELFEQMAKDYGETVQGVPMIFIDSKVFIGFSDSIATSLEEEINRCFVENCPLLSSTTIGSDSLTIQTASSPLEDPSKTELKKALTIPAVLSAAVVDAINPCAFAVLIILLTTILATKNRHRALTAGLAFSLSIYISYLLMGIGLYSAINATGIAHWFYLFVGFLAILIGLFNLKDYLWYGKWFVMEVPLSWRPRMKSLIRGITSVPGAFLIGFAVSLFLLPCTSGPYIVILGLLAKTATKNFALMLLLLYNFVFILPMLMITLAIYFGFTTTEKAEEWRQSKLKWLHFIAGVILLVLGIAMLISVWLGLI